MNVYFDNAATTRVCGEAADAVHHIMREDYGNPSSSHYMGRRAAAELEKARRSVADAIGASTGEIYFTSGGTESDDWAVFGACEASSRRGKHIIISAIEHDAVAEPVKKLEGMGWEVTRLMPDSEGRIPAEAFEQALRDDTVFASVMLVNNETGTVNPVREYADAIRRKQFNVLLHTDAVQGLCKTPIAVKSLGAALVTVSAHKIHGPKGVGALYIKEGIKLPPFVFGGGQEVGKRSGTEALPAIAGFGAAARSGLESCETAALKVRELREHIIRRLDEELPGYTVVVGDGSSPYVLCLSLPGYKSEVLVSFLEGEGICAAKGAACAKGRRSRVLEAMRLGNDVIDGALRVSFSKYNTLDEAEFFVQSLKKAARTLLTARGRR